MRRGWIIISNIDRRFYVTCTCQTISLLQGRWWCEADSAVDVSQVEVRSDLEFGTPTNYERSPMPWPMSSWLYARQSRPEQQLSLLSHVFGPTCGLLGAGSPLAMTHVAAAARSITMARRSLDNARLLLGFGELLAGFPEDLPVIPHAQPIRGSCISPHPHIAILNIQPITYTHAYLSGFTSSCTGTAQLFWRGFNPRET